MPRFASRSSQADTESVVEPDCVTDDFGRESVSAVARSHLVSLTVNVTIPSDTGIERRDNTLIIAVLCRAES